MIELICGKIILLLISMAIWVCVCTMIIFLVGTIFEDIADEFVVGVFVAIVAIFILGFIISMTYMTYKILMWLV